jgi:hypothetical protein
MEQAAGKGVPWKLVGPVARLFVSSDTYFTSAAK